MLIQIALSIAAMYATGFWLAGLALAVLFVIWRILRPEEGPAIFALALTYQWVQVSIGLFYSGLTGDMLQAFGAAWDEMVLIGLGCVLLLAIGGRLGMWWVGNSLTPVEPGPQQAVTRNTLLIAYGASIATTGIVQQVAWDFPALTQAILALNLSHLGLVYLMLRRFSRPTFQWSWVIGVVCFEVVLGFTGYFANFREPLIITFIMMTETFDRRDVKHWALVGGLVVALGTSSILWLSVRDQYRADFDEGLYAASRAERLERVSALGEGVLGQDVGQVRDTIAVLADRMWTIYYPALTLDRVPSFVAHTNGELLSSALYHLVTPRLLFPDKGELPSDSEMVRKYAGVNVAGYDEGTSIAFGYAGEAYVDFGVPLMFLPVLVWGVVLGSVYRYFLHLIRHRELAISLVTVVFWIALYIFERSWVKTMGTTITVAVYLGGITFLIDRYLIGRRAQMMLDLHPAPTGELSR